MRRTWPITDGFEGGGRGWGAQEYQEPLDAEKDPWLTFSKERRTLVLQLLVLNMASLKADSPQNLLVRSLVLVLWKLEQENQLSQPGLLPLEVCDNQYKLQICSNSLQQQWATNAHTMNGWWAEVLMTCSAGESYTTHQSICHLPPAPGTLCFGLPCIWGSKSKPYRCAHAPVSQSCSVQVSCPDLLLSNPALSLNASLDLVLGLLSSVSSHCLISCTFPVDSTWFPSQPSVTLLYLVEDSTVFPLVYLFAVYREGNKKEK